MSDPVRQQDQITCIEAGSLGVDAKPALPRDDDVKAWAIIGRECQPPWRSQVTAGRSYSLAASLARYR